MPSNLRASWPTLISRKDRSLAVMRACQDLIVPWAFSCSWPKASISRAWMSPRPSWDQSLPRTACPRRSAPPSALPWASKLTEAPPERSATSKVSSTAWRSWATPSGMPLTLFVSTTVASCCSKDEGSSPWNEAVNLPDRASSDGTISQRPSRRASSRISSASKRLWPSRETEAGHQSLPPRSRMRVGVMRPARSSGRLTPTSIRSAVKTSPVSPMISSVMSSAAKDWSGRIQKCRACRRRPCWAKRLVKVSVKLAGSWTGESSEASQSSASWTGKSRLKLVMSSPRRNLRNPETAGAFFIAHPFREEG